MSEFLIFKEIENTGRLTKVFNVSNKTGDALGVIKWKSSWRRYVYISNYCDYDISCLNNIVSFISILMDDRKMILNKK